MSALYLNNKKVQAAKTNQNTLKCFELFGDFIEQYKLVNTSEVFSSEADYKKNNEIRKQLNDVLAPKQKTPLVQTLVEKTKNLKPTTIKEESKTFKLQMDDLQAKSAKLDQMLERRKQTEDKKMSQPDSFQVVVPVVTSKQAEIAKFTNILEDSQKHEPKKPKPEESPKKKVSQNQLKPNNSKQVKDESISDFSVSESKQQMANMQAKGNVNSSITSNKDKQSVTKPAFIPPKLNILKTNSNSESNDFLAQEDKLKSSNKNQQKDGSVLNTENDDFMTISHGVDNTVDSDILEEYDYVESIEKF